MSIGIHFANHHAIEDSLPECPNALRRARGMSAPQPSHRACATCPFNAIQPGVAAAGCSGSYGSGSSSEFHEYLQRIDPEGAVRFRELALQTGHRLNPVLTQKEMQEFVRILLPAWRALRGVSFLDHPELAGPEFVLRQLVPLCEVGLRLNEPVYWG